MNICGYERDSENFVHLREASLVCNLDNLDKIIEFLQYVRQQHTTELQMRNDLIKAKKMDIKDINVPCHSHYRDWDKNWTKEQTDLIILTTFEE